MRISIIFRAKTLISKYPIELEWIYEHITTASRTTSVLWFKEDKFDLQYGRKLIKTKRFPSMCENFMGDFILKGAEKCTG